MSRKTGADSATPVNITGDEGGLLSQIVALLAIWAAA